MRQPPAPKKIVMMIGRGGGGHKASARAIEAVLRSASTMALSFESVDTGYLFESITTGQPMRTEGFDCDEFYNILMRRGWFRIAGWLGLLPGILLCLRGRALRRGVAEFWMKQQPDLVISFVPYVNAILRDSLLTACPGAALLTVVTDFETSPSHRWIDPWDAALSSRHFVVAGGALLQRQVAELGYPREQVMRTPGMVVHPSFHDVASGASDASAGAAEPPPSVATALVCFGGYAPDRCETIVEGLRATHQHVAVVVLCGGNDGLRARLTSRGDCEAEGFIPSEQVRARMRRATFIIGKPGPGVVTEACACGTPFVTERRYAMPQEQPVLQWINETGVGVVVDNLTELPPNLLERLEGCQPAIDAHRAARPAVWQVADGVHALLSSTPPSLGPCLGSGTPVLALQANRLCNSKADRRSWRSWFANPFASPRPLALPSADGQFVVDSDSSRPGSRSGEPLLDNEVKVLEGGMTFTHAEQQAIFRVR